MKTLRLFVSGLIVIILAGCGTPRPQMNWEDTVEISGGITATRDEFKKQISYIGPKYKERGRVSYVFLRAWKDRSNEVTYQIYVMDWYPGEWRFYNSAYDSDGNTLDSTVISRKVDTCSNLGCSHEEHIGLNVSRDYLVKNQSSGIRFKLSGKAGETVLSIPAAYVKAFVDFTG